MSEPPRDGSLAALVNALESDQGFPLSQLYSLSYSQFELTLEILGEWRLDRHCSSKGRHLQYKSLHASELAGG
jgi:hypothetical protein